MKNVKSIAKTKAQKEQSVKDNRLVLDYIYYICRGFFIKQQLLPVIAVISGISYKNIKLMIQDLCEKGLLIQKQVTTTKAVLYVMTGFALAQYSKHSSQNTTSIKLNNQKIWTNLFRMEYLIQEILPNVAGKITSCKGLVRWLDYNFVDIYRVQNQEDIFKLYYKFYQKFPVLNKNNETLPVGEFTNDYLACTAEYYDFILRFQNKIAKAKKYEGYEQYKHKKTMNQSLYSSMEERNKNCFNFSQMAGQGFFIESLLNEGVIKIGMFDTYKNLQLQKIYKNGIYMLFMLQRYLNIVPEIHLTIYVRNGYTKDRLERETKHLSYNYAERESSGYDKRTDFFYRAGVLAWKDKIKVEYKVYELEKKYHL